MKQRALFFGCVVLMAVLAGPATAAGLALGGKVGTVGAGLDLSLRLMDRLNVRLNGNYLPLSLDRRIEDIDFSADLTLGSLFGMLDWHPFANNFRISVGAVYNGNELELHATPSKPVEIGDVTYLPVHIGTLTGSATFNTVAGYIGIGFGNAVEKERGWGFVFDLGVLFQGAPDVELSSNGLLMMDPTFRANLEKERRKIQDDVEWFQFYPVLAFGISYQF